MFPIEFFDGQFTFRYRELAGGHRISVAFSDSGEAGFVQPTDQVAEDSIRDLTEFGPFEPTTSELAELTAFLQAVVDILLPTRGIAIDLRQGQFTFRFDLSRGRRLVWLIFADLGEVGPVEPTIDQMAELDRLVEPFGHVFSRARAHAQSSDPPRGNVPDEEAGAVQSAGPGDAPPGRSEISSAPNRRPHARPPTK